MQVKMSSEGSPNRILLVVDVQRALIDPPNPVPGSTKILRNLEAVLARERAASPPTKGMSSLDICCFQDKWELSVAELLAGNSKTTTRYVILTNGSYLDSARGRR